MPPVVPAWVRLIDAIAVLLLVLAAWIALTGGGRYLVLGVVLPLRSAAVPIFAALALQLIRHVLVPRPSALDRLAALDDAIAARPAFAAALRPFLATRALVLLIGLFAVMTFGPAPASRDGLRVSNHPVINLPARFDAGWYGGIALDGYSWDGDFRRQQSIAFFPAFPLLTRALGALFGAYGEGLPPDARMARMLWAGVVLAMAAFFSGLYYLVRLGQVLIGHDRAADAAMLLAAYPFAVFYSAPYTEALFLVAATGASFHMLRHQWGAAAAWGLVAGLSRPNGFVLGVLLAGLAWQHWRASERSWRAIATPFLVAAAPVVGMLAFTVYLHQLTGVWFAWARSHAAWGRTLGGVDPLSSAWTQLSREPFIQVVGNAPYEALNTLGLLFALALIWPVFRRLGSAWALFVAASVAAPLMAGGVLSLGRLTSTLFPLFLALAAVLPPRAVPACTAAFALLQGLAAALFFTWRDLY